MADNTNRIAAIRRILQEGVSSITEDGQTVSYDLDQLRRELRQLEQADGNERRRRPTASRIRLDNL